MDAGRPNSSRTPIQQGSAKDYGADAWSRAEFGRLAERLRRLEANWLPSINDPPEIRRLFDGYAIEDVRTLCGVGAQCKSGDQAKPKNR